MPTLDNVATIVRIPSAVVFIICIRVKLCPEDAWNVRVELRAGDLYFGASIVLDSPVGSPEDELLATCGNRDAYKVTKENPVLTVAVVFSDHAERMGVGRERRLYVAVLFRRSETIGDTELFSYGLGLES